MTSMPRDVGGRFPVADNAVPSITLGEIVDIDTAICRYHGGRIANGLAAGDFYGKVMYCPLGGMAWRLTKTMNQMMVPLRWGWRC